MSDKAIFIDRDDTLIKDPGYISSPDQVELLDGAAEALIKLKELGYKLIVASNQSAVARGMVTEKVLDKIHDRLKQLLAEKDAFLDRIYYCPYHPDGVVPKYRKESKNRKPNPGMLLTAAKELDIDLSQSWCIGNSDRDIEAGHRAGCKTILIDAPSRQKQSDPRSSQSGVTPDYRGVNLREAVNIIKKHLRSSAGTQTQAPLTTDVQTELVPETEDTTPSQIESTPKIDESAPEEEQSSTDETVSEPIVTETAEEIAEPAPNETEEPPQSEQKKRRATSTEQEMTFNRTEQLLVDILGQLKTMQRTEMFSEFSIMRLLAGILQIIALFCLLITVWFLMSPENQNNSIFIALGFAIVFQLMSLTLYIMHGRK
jgi:D-glycero-D-manno-heptose 1,7-bisphosphate phosphatase